MARAFIVLLLFGIPAWSQDIDIAIRPDPLHVESAGGNLQPMERLFFHIIVHNTSTKPLTIESLQFELGNGQVSTLSGKYSGAGLMSLFDSAIDRRRIEPTARETLELGPDERKAVTDIFLEWPIGHVGDAIAVEVHYQIDGKTTSHKTTGMLERFAGFTGRLPLNGVWYVSAEHGYVDHHKRSAIEAFAYDFLQIGANGRSYQRDGARNTDYFAYGEKVVAAGGGVVAAVRGDIPENVPGTINPENPGGNFVVIDHGQDQFSYYGNLRNIAVKVGARVEAGDTIGEVGNSGDSREPHLHFHVMNSANIEEADPLPVLFRNWRPQAYGRSTVVQDDPELLPRGEFVEPSVGLP
jgi:murein DD-endopeptidase MepM/ murein hydrolase activator NlpD